MKWLNYHVVIDERRGCGQEKKKTTKKQPEKATSSVFVGSFCTFGFTCAVTLPHLGKDTLKKEPGIYLFFLWKTFWDNTKKKTNSSAQWDFLHDPRLFQHVFLPTWWTSSCPSVLWPVGDLSKSLSLCFSNKQKTPASCFVTTSHEEMIGDYWLEVKADRSLMDDGWFGKNKRFRYFVQSCMKLSLNFWVISLKKTQTMRTSIHETTFIS